MRAVKDDFEEKNESFVSLVEKKLVQRVKKARWSPAMDLLAVLYRDDQLSVHRLNWQKLWSVSLESSAESICWKPNGKLIAVGNQDGSVFLLDVENGTLLYKLSLHRSPVSCISWTWFQDQGPKDQDEKIDRLQVLLGEPIPPQDSDKGGMDGNGWAEAAIWPDVHEAMNVLCSCDCQGTVVLSAFGVVKIMQLDLAGKADAVHAIEKVWSVLLSSNGGMLSTVHAVRRTTAEADKKLHARVFDLSLLAKKRQEIHQISILSARTSMLLQLSKRTLEAVSKSWMSMADSFHRKVKLQLETCLKDDGSMNSPHEELLLLLACGVPTRAMEQFLLVMPGESGLKRIAKQMDSVCTDVHDLLLQRAYPNLRMVLVLLEDLLGLSRCVHKIEKLGVSEVEVNSALHLVTLLLVQVQRVADAVEIVRGQLHLFFKWLQSVVWINAGEKEEKQTEQESISIGLHEMDRIVEFLERHYTEDCIAPHFCNALGDGNVWPTSVEADSSNILNDAIKELLQLDFSDERNSLSTPLKKLFSMVEQSLVKIFDAPLQHLSSSSTATAPIILGTIEDSECSCSDIQELQDKFLVAFSNLEAGLQLVQFSGSAYPDVGSARISVGGNGMIEDVMFYKQQSLAVLHNMEEVGSELLLLDCQDLKFTDKPDLVVQLLPPATRRRSFSHSACKPLAVMGSRGVACVVFDRRRIQLLDLEEDEEEEDDEEDEDTDG